jgi:YidC/Oxa1 family membrane protein insertase
MEQARLLIAIVLSALVFLVWQFFFVDREEVQKSAQKTTQPPAKSEPVQQAKPYTAGQEGAVTETAGVTESTVAKPAEVAGIITVDTPLYRAQISEKGAGFISFILKNYRQSVAKDSALKEIIPPEHIFKTVLLGYDGTVLKRDRRSSFFRGNPTRVLSLKKPTAFHRILT